MTCQSQTQPRLVGDPAALARGIYSSAVDVCVAGANGSVLARDFRGVPVVSVYRWLTARDLCLVVKISQEEAFEASRDPDRTILASAALVLLAAGLAATWLARTITRPILALQVPGRPDEPTFHRAVPAMATTTRKRLIDNTLRFIITILLVSSYGFG